MLDMTLTETKAVEAKSRTETRTKRMGATPEEFFRQLKAFAPDGAEIDTARGEARIRSESGTARVRVAREPARRLGALTLPVTAVAITLDNFSETAAEAFWAGFQKSFLRMGG